MSSPIIYQWSDSGGPGRSLSGNLQNRLKQMLVPCLVTGYGGKPGAGWSLAHEHENGFTLGNKRGDFFINFVSGPSIAGLESRSIRIYAANSCIDIGGAVIDGANLCSGLFRKEVFDSSDFQFIGNVQQVIQDRLSSLMWTIIADGLSFFLTASAQGGDLATSSVHIFPLYAGDLAFPLIPETPVVLGGALGSNAPGTKYLFSGGYSAPRSPKTGINEHAPLYSPFYAVGVGGGFDKNPSALPRSLRFCAPSIFTDGIDLGCVRGVVRDEYLEIQKGNWAYYCRCLGLLGAHFDERSDLVEINGDSYVLARGWEANWFATDSADFW